MATQQIEDPVKRKIAEYALITVSIWIMVVGIYFFKFPNNFSFGGVTGFSSVVSRLTGMNASDFTFIVNTGLLVMGFLFLGTDVSRNHYRPADAGTDLCNLPSGRWIRSFI